MCDNLWNIMGLLGVWLFVKSWFPCACSTTAQEETQRPCGVCCHHGHASIWIWCCWYFADASVPNLDLITCWCCCSSCPGIPWNRRGDQALSSRWKCSTWSTRTCALIITRVWCNVCSWMLPIPYVDVFIACICTCHLHHGYCKFQNAIS